MNKLLTTFNRSLNSEYKPNICEKAGNIGLGLLRIGFGKTITVKKISGGDNKITFTEKVYSTSAKVTAIALFILACPITIPLAGIGYIGMSYSKSHRQIFNLYNQSAQTPIPEVKNSSTPNSILAPQKITRTLPNPLNAKIGQSNAIPVKSRQNPIPEVKNFPTPNSVLAPQKTTPTAPHPLNGKIGRSNVTPVIRLNTPENKAATIIQKYVRGYLKRKPFLPSYLYPQYREQCERALKPNSNLPRANGGRTTVYLPQEVPEVVLKQSSREKAIIRFHKMQTVRSILNSQKSSHLIIPKAQLCGDFLVEERLPINVDIYHNMGLYISQPELFDEAVRELTRLFSKRHLSDLVNRQNDFTSYIYDVNDSIRYDNLPLYIVEENGKKEGKIGLIDLEDLKDGGTPQALQDLVRIFPFHLNVIKNEAHKLKMQVNESSLNNYAEKGKNHMQVGFIDHLDWLKQKHVSTKISSQLFQVTPERVQELSVLVEKELIKLNQGLNDFAVKVLKVKVSGNFFIKNPEKTSQELATSITPLIISNVQAEIKKKQNQQLSKLSASDMTESQLVKLRSCMINRAQLYEGICKLISESQATTLEYEFEQEYIAEQLTFIIMENLVKGGEFFSFNPGYKFGHNDICWIRY